MSIRSDLDMAFNFLEDSADRHRVSSYSLPECMEDDLQNVFEDRMRLRAEVERLRGQVHMAAHSFKDNWCIDWGPLFDVMEEVDEEVA